MRSRSSRPRTFYQNRSLGTFSHSETSEKRSAFSKQLWTLMEEYAPVLTSPERILVDFLLHSLSLVSQAAIYKTLNSACAECLWLTQAKNSRISTSSRQKAGPSGQ